MNEIEQMSRQWHAVSDHAADGAPFGGWLCNCNQIARRAASLGWAPAPADTPEEHTNV